MCERDRRLGGKGGGSVVLGEEGVKYAFGGSGLGQKLCLGCLFVSFQNCRCCSYFAIHRYRLRGNLGKLSTLVFLLSVKFVADISTVPACFSYVMFITLGREFAHSNPNLGII